MEKEIKPQSEQKKEKYCIEPPTQKDLNNLHREIYIRVFSKEVEQFTAIRNKDVERAADHAMKIADIGIKQYKIRYERDI